MQLPICHGLFLLQTYLNEYLNNQHYLVLVDSYSGWFEIDQLNSLSSLGEINKPKRHFSTHGIPQKLYSDNGTQFTSQTFCDFARSRNFLHVTSSPEYPQSKPRRNRLLSEPAEPKEHAMGQDPRFTCTETFVQTDSNNSAYQQTDARASCTDNSQHQSPADKEVQSTKTILMTMQPELLMYLILYSVL